MVALQTLAAARSGSTLADKPELDLLLRLAGTRQIGEALRLAGYKSGGKRLFIVAASQGRDGELLRVKKRLAKERRIVALPKRRLEKEDLDYVERAALLAARL
jgi:tRNA threonylcarbamoyladenosine modification (KEOPS) complex Cgi121 subunit